MITTVTLNPALDKLYWVDELSKDLETPLVRAKRSISSAGGKGVNVSIFLARMGVENVAMGFVAGHTGRVIVKKLREEGITTNFTWVDGETRTNVIILERGREKNPIEVHERGLEVPESAIAQFLQKYKRILNRTEYVVLSGSLPPGIENGFYRELVKLASEQGVKTVLNVGGEPLSLAIEACPYLVKPDIRERKEVGGVKMDTTERLIGVCRECVNRGTEVMLISHGITGDILITRSGIWDFEAQDVEFKNIVGAEDALIGGILYKIYQEGSPIEEATRFGMAAAVANAESPKVMEIGREEIEKEMGKIRMVKL